MRRGQVRRERLGFCVRVARGLEHGLVRGQLRRERLALFPRVCERAALGLRLGLGQREGSLVCRGMLRRGGGGGLCGVKVLSRGGQVGREGLGLRAGFAGRCERGLVHRELCGKGFLRLQGCGQLGTRGFKVALGALERTLGLDFLLPQRLSRGV